MTETIEHQGQVLAIIVPGSHSSEGIEFFTPDDYSQQLAYMHHPAGKAIVPHRHNPAPREVTYTNEVLFIRKGKLRVDFFTDDEQYIKSRILGDGDVILLIRGGHGFEVLEELEMIEVKQGPFAGEQDKTRFEAKINKLKLD